LLPLMFESSQEFMICKVVANHVEQSNDKDERSGSFEMRRKDERIVVIKLENGR